MKQMLNWDFDKNLDDFNTIEEQLRNEGQTSRADAILYLIERCKVAEQQYEKERINSITAYEKGYKEGETSGTFNTKAAIDGRWT